ncbi:MAG: hypothetical protein Q9161_002366 [Pseudevernia consocians]
MHRILLFLSYAIAARAANPLLTQRQSGTSGGEPGINACLDPENSAPNTKSTTCTPKYVMDTNGDCGPLTWDNSCRAYCQVSVQWSYGTETPFNRTFCQNDDPVCSITSTSTSTVTNSVSFNVGITLGTKRDLEGREDSGPSLGDLTATFNAGATWEYSTSYAQATAVDSERPPLSQKKCGYWTFIPYYVTSCGSITIGEWSTSSSGEVTTGGADVTAGCTNAKTTGDWCQTVPMTDAHGTPLGETIFVAASCCAHWPIGWCRQESVYLIEGVSNNATIYNDYKLSHTNYDMTLPIESTANITCMAGEWPYNEDNGASGDPAGPACAPNDVGI